MSASMRNVSERLEVAVRNVLSSQGFCVSSTGGVMRVGKHGCGAEFRRMACGATR
jgi:hypothetical protein